MDIFSFSIGLLCGALWGSFFTTRYRFYVKSPIQTESCKSSAWFLASTSIIRYLLLAALLAILLTKYHVSLSWWLGGFFTSFWVLLIQNVCNNSNLKRTAFDKEQNGNLDI